jgi:hypothetical protein
MGKAAGEEAKQLPRSSSVAQSARNYIQFRITHLDAMIRAFHWAQIQLMMNYRICFSVANLLHVTMEANTVINQEIIWKRTSSHTHYFILQTTSSIRMK